MPQSRLWDLAPFWWCGGQRGAGRVCAILKRLPAALQPQAYSKAKHPRTESLINRWDKTSTFFFGIVSALIDLNRLYQGALQTSSVTETQREALIWSSFIKQSYKFFEVNIIVISEIMITENNRGGVKNMYVRKPILISCEAIKLSKPGISGPSRRKGKKNKNRKLCARSRQSVDQQVRQQSLTLTLTKCHIPLGQNTKIKLIRPNLFPPGRMFHPNYLPLLFFFFI